MTSSLCLSFLATIGFVTALATSTEFVPTASSATTATTGTSWRQLNLRVPTPGALRYGAATYDGARGEVVLFGGLVCTGFAPCVYSNDTWTWDGSKWMKENPGTSPSTRYGAQMVYDSQNQKAILFGGTDETGKLLNDTWAWDGSNWTRLSPANSPPLRSSFSLAYDVANDRVVLFGGLGRDPLVGFGVPLGDTWVFDGTTWNEVGPLVSPTPRSAAGLTYDAARGEVVLFGGCAESITCTGGNETWTWDGTTWTREDPVTSPPARANPSITYDVARQETVLFLTGSVRGPGATWTWNGQNWQQKDAQEINHARPHSRYAGVFVYHAGVGRVLMYGGGFSGVWDDQWTWDGTSWTQANLGLPTARGYQHQMAFDTDRDQAVLFGGVGYSLSQYMSDTWTWDGMAWTLVRPATLPRERARAAITYDAARRVTVLFGGSGGDGNRLGDTWTFDGFDWTKKSPATTPPGREGGTIAFDSASQKVVLFGGVPQPTDVDRYPGPLSDTWTWDGSTWTHEQPSVNPPARLYHAMARDAQGRPVVFGGQDVDFNALNDTWRWNGTSHNWEQVALSGPTPPARYAHSMAHDGGSGQIILFGGTVCVPGDCHAASDTWTWDGINWAEQQPVAAPSARGFAPMADGSVTNPVTLAGGGYYLPDDPTTWTWGMPVPPVPLTSVTSRKTHDSAGPFDVSLPLTGKPGVECRRGGASGGYTMVFKFANTLTSVGGASVTGGTGTVSSSATDSSDAHNYIVNLTGVTNAQAITVSLSNVNDSGGNSSASVAASMGVLLGDTTGDGVVDSGDITQVRRQSGQVTAEASKRIDLSVDGVINSGDITLVRRQSGTALPTP